VKLFVFDMEFDGASGEADVPVGELIDMRMAAIPGNDSMSPSNAWERINLMSLRFEIHLTTQLLMMLTNTGRTNSRKNEPRSGDAWM